MELSALGIPLEPVRYIWLIAFIVYIGLCIVPAITHPATISTEKAKELYIARYGSPVNNAMRYAERRSLEGNPLPKHKLRSNLTRARKEIDSVYGISSIEAWFHVLMYVWACLVARSIFRLYTDIAHNGILLPALLLPFLMVYWAARWGRRGWRVARGFSPNERHLGMPAIYTRTLGRLSAPFRGTVAMPSSEPIQVDWKGQGIFLFVAVPVGGFFLLCYLHSLANTELLEYVPTYIGKTSIAFLVVYVLAIPYLWCTVRSYYQFTPTVVKRGRFFRSPKVYRYSDIERFKVYPWYTGDPEDIDPDQQMPSDWRLAVTFSNGSQQTFGFGDYRIDCLVAHIAFKLEQERWADVDSPADRERLPLYFVEGRAICLTLGYKPTNELTKKAARIASFRAVN